MALLHFTDSSFKKEVLESELPVLVDLWAPWCVDLSTIISMDGRNNKFASEIEKDSYVLGYNGKKIKKYKIINSKTSRTLGHCKRIISDTGREIKVTDEHRFYTPQGWKMADELNIGDKVAVYPSSEFIHYKRTNRGKNFILGKDIRKYAFKNMKIDTYIKELKDKGLLPLRPDSPKLLILARLIGAQFSDGSLYSLRYNNYREISFSVGQIEDVEELKQDLNNLGFKCTSKKKISNCNINGRTFVMHSYVVRCRSTALWLLLRALGVPAGNKTNTAYKIPDWLMKAEDGLQREFLAAYLGGDGPTVNIRLKKREARKPYNSLLINDIEFHKREDLEKSGLILAHQIGKLLSKFDVKVNKVFTEADKYKRKDKTKAKIIHLQIQNNFESGYNLCQKVGYLYANQKSSKARFVGEFLKKRQFERQLCNQKYKEAISLFKGGKRGIKDIAIQLGLSYGTVFAWIKYNRKPTIFKHFEKYPMWLREAKRGLRDGLLWEEIKRIEPTYLNRVQSLVVEKAHNFIGNGFLTHNCGPCRMIAPIVEELAKEYSGKIKIGKINIDENPAVPTQYGVMSIPMLMFFNKGKVIEQAVGALSKAELKKKIEHNLK